MKKRGPEEYERLVRAVLLVLMFVSACFIVRGGARLASSGQVEGMPGKERLCVVIDAGHGGADPGKVSVDGSLEKDINLVIAKKLQKFLLQQDVDAVLTRDSDSGLYDENASNKKVQDMKNRCALINETQPDCVVSIHQNSYHEEYVHGAQVFYYKGSDGSKAAAEIMQKSLKDRLDPENKREAKANGSYYLLKKTSSPIIIVECGFLSNSQEAEKLSGDEYQERVAWAVFMGIMQMLNSQ